MTEYSVLVVNAMRSHRMVHVSQKKFLSHVLCIDLKRGKCSVAGVTLQSHFVQVGKTLSVKNLNQ